MNENAKKWSKALRSGDYGQATDALQSSCSSFCCLGVAARVYEKETGDELPRDSHGNYSSGQLHGPFEKVRVWLGLKTSFGKFGSSNGIGSDSLANLNDGGKNFEEIANIIESEPEGLFVD